VAAGSPAGGISSAVQHPDFVLLGCNPILLRAASMDWYSQGPVLFGNHNGYVIKITKEMKTLGWSKSKRA